MICCSRPPSPRNSESILSGFRINTISKTIQVPAADADIFRGHFDEAAIVPGVVLLQWAIEFATGSLAGDLSFRAVEQLKFRRVVQPAMRLQLCLSLPAEHPDCFDFRYLEANEEIASGRVRFSGVQGLRADPVLSS